MQAIFAGCQHAEIRELTRVSDAISSAVGRTQAPSARQKTLQWTRAHGVLRRLAVRSIGCEKLFVRLLEAFPPHDLRYDGIRGSVVDLDAPPPR